eukprot:4401534-Pleurochrysis_carterae.AAC.4
MHIDFLRASVNNALKHLTDPPLQPKGLCMLWADWREPTPAAAGASGFAIAATNCLSAALGFDRSGWAEASSACFGLLRSCLPP